MKTIKFYPSNRSVIKLDGKRVKGYTISNIPDECNSWFNYKGLTYVLNQSPTGDGGQRGQVLAEYRKNPMTVLDMRGSNPLSRSKIKQMTKLSTQDINLIVRLLHQELDAVSDIIERGQDRDINWMTRLDHCEDLIMKLLR